MSNEALESRFYHWLKPHEPDVGLRSRAEFYGIFRDAGPRQADFLNKLGSVPYSLRAPLISYITAGGEPEPALLSYLETDEAQPLMNLILDVSVKSMQGAHCRSVRLSEHVHAVIRSGGTWYSGGYLLGFSALCFIVGIVFGWALRGFTQ